MVSDAHVDMRGVYKRKQTMVDGLVSLHRDRFHSSGVELIMGEAKFTEERTANVALTMEGRDVLPGTSCSLVSVRAR